MKTYGVDHKGPVKSNGDPGTAGQVFVSQGGTNPPQWKALKNNVAKNTNYVALVNDIIFADTSSSEFTVTLPASPNLGDEVIIIDEESSFDVHNLTIDRNGNTIMGIADNLALDLKNVRVIFSYDGDTWQVHAMLSAGI